MSRGVALSYPLETVLLAQRGLTVALSGYNALYFATYRSHRGRRRLGAVVLTLINLAIGAESLAFALPKLLGKYSLWLPVGSHIAAASLSLAAALVMAALIIRNQLRKH